MIRRLLAGAVAFIAVLLAACEPVPGQVTVAGDSISLLAGYFGGDYRDATQYLTLGARASTHQAQIEADANNPAMSPQVLVMAYGHNYYSTRFSAADIAELGRMVNTVDDDACVVLVLPAYVGFEPIRTDVINRYRRWALDQANALPDVVAADWAPVALPEFFGPDGFHIVEGPAADAFTSVVNAGVDECFEVLDT